MKNLQYIFILALCLLSIPALRAKEGADQYPFGAENWFAGALPGPGFYFINYAGYYGGQLKDGSGQNANLGGTTPTVAATFDAFRFLQITPYKFLGADWGVHVIVPVVNQRLDMGGFNRFRSVGDIDVDPFILGWHRPQWHAAAACDFILPTGHYDKNDPRVSIGAHYVSFEPIAAFSYLPKSGWEASVKLMYNLKTTNSATQYHSGQEFHADYAVGKHLRSWMFGAAGYAVKQTTSDLVNGEVVAAMPEVWDIGRRGQALAIGPSIAYETKRHMVFVLKWEHETLVENRFGGDKFWFKVILPSTSLFGGPKQHSSNQPTQTSLLGDAPQLLP